MIDLVPTFCGKDCGGGACPLLAKVEDGRVTQMLHNPAGMDLKPCPRGYALHHAHDAPDRLLSPLIADRPRGSGRFREAGWDEALDIVAHRLGSIRSDHGPASVIGLGSDGSTGALHSSENLLARFLNSGGGATMLASNYSNGAASFALPYLFGAAAKQSGWDAATVRHSRLVVLWGANIMEARLGTELGTAIAAAARTGVPVVVIDPRRTRTATALGARWIPILPGTDAAMMLAVLHVLFRDGLVDKARVSRLAIGLEDIERYVSGYIDGIARSPRWAEHLCGVPASVIESFAHEFAASTPAMLVPGYSMQRVHNGEETFRLSVALQVAAGNFGVPGGSSGSINNRLPSPRIGSLPDLGRGTSPSIPVLRWPDAILRGTAGGYPADIRAAWVAGFNAVNQGGDSRKSIEAMRSLEFSVCSEMFMTPTARLCDVVLPVASPLEKEDIGLPWHGNYLLYKRAAVASRGLARSDYDIFADAARRMGFGQTFTEGRTASQWIDHFLGESEIDDVEAFRRTGVYFGADRERIGLADFAADPQAHPLPTPSGLIELSSQAWARDTGRPSFPVWTDHDRDAELPFLLITPKTIHRTNSQDGGGAPWASTEQAPTTRPDAGALTIARADATRLQIRDGDALLVRNGRGAVMVTALVSDDIVPGAVCMHEGVWLDIGKDGLDQAGSANILTSTDGSGPAIAAVMHGVGVAVKKA
jgi:anaerobic dimethyl sulfoxide reductase subunit A